MALEEMLSMVEDADLAMQLVEEYRKDDSNKAIYNKAIEKVVEYTGIRPDVDSNGNVIELNPRGIKTILKTWQATAGNTLDNYTTGNLEAVLKGLGNKSTMLLQAPSIKPNESETYTDANKLHSKYLEMIYTLSIVDGETRERINPKMRKQAEQNIKASAQGISKKRIQEYNDKKEAQDRISEANLEIWADTMAYLANNINRDLATNLYKSEAKNVFGELTKTLGSNVDDYLAGSISGMKAEERKQLVYPIIYQVAKLEDEAVVEDEAIVEDE